MAVSRAMLKTCHSISMRVCGRFAFAIALLSVALLACDDESSVALQPTTGQNVWTLTMNARALTLAVGETYQLDAIARTSTGAAIPDVPQVTYVPEDASKLTLTSDGLLTATAATTGTTVIASLTDRGVTTRDTITVVVTEFPRTFKALSIQPFDGTTIGVGGAKFLSPMATDSTDSPLFGIAVRFVSSDPTLATVTSTGYVSAKAKGTVHIWATTTTYGVTRADTVTLTITNPMMQTVYMYGSLYPTLGAFNPALTIVGRTGTVTWWNYSGATSSITFESGVADIPDGHITTLPLNGSATRTFPVVGTYQFKDALGHVSYVYVIPE